MKIVGIGVDIVDNKRFKNLIKDNKFINRIFSKKEIFDSKKTLNKINFFSKRFAAKESFAKALGTGFRNNLNFKDIEIVNDNLGKPFYLINNKIKQIIKKNKKIANFELFLSISDEKDYSVAFTIIQKI
ncbi:holo-ACP synthase [Candidatus Pelagibacter bacterium]|nr:holo-ACP synthase [Candidatus Pelagibacter bacterium]